MIKMICFIIVAVMLAGCGEVLTERPAPEQVAEERERPPEPVLEQDNKPLNVPEQTPAHGPSYIESVIRETVSRITGPGMSEYDKAKAAFDYIIQTTSLTEPIGLELWRVRGENDPLPSFVENRSLSVLLFGVGMCEDYAAALTSLLLGMGIEAQYVPGLTFAADGRGFTDHAWVIAKIDGEWYHLDVQLEQNITRRETIRYQYFMKSDATMLSSHRWGQNMIDTGLMTLDQNAEIARDFKHPDCPRDYDLPPPNIVGIAGMPDLSAIQAAVEEEISGYEAVNGVLEPMELNIIPPVFALKGYNRA
ncbi:MAG: transglutaminase-like domain-containing protein [Oscillospiraceae bacterium]|nr:transglutaminase-like domain-containing protein [Oscillospiraceae bacterium]